MTAGQTARIALLTALAAWGSSQLAGCAEAPLPVNLGPPVESYSHQDYREVLERWTRHDNVILLSSLDNTLKVSATLLSPDFSAAYLARKIHVYRLSDAQRQKLRLELEQEQAKSYSFFVAAATPDPSWNDFGRDPSIWHIALVNDAKEQVSPLKINTKKKITAAIEDFYPYVGNFYQIYTIRFPHTLPDGRQLVRPETTQLTLRFAGPLGVAELSWRLQ